MPTVTRDYDFSTTGGTIVAEQVDSEFDKLYAAINDLEQDNLAAALQALLVPPGTVSATAADSADTGYLLCDGSVVSRATYAALFARVGTKYNTGGEAGTDFRLPDYRGRLLVGKGTHADVNDLADNDGQAVASRTPKHASAGDHSHAISSPAAGTSLPSQLATNIAGGGSAVVAGQFHTHELTGFTQASGMHSHGTVPFHAVNYQIKI